MEEFKSWESYALSIVRQALTSRELKGNHLATLAALSIIHQELERGHPSYYNSQFAVGAFFLHPTSPTLRLYAWRIVLNGLGGYWQWHAHNGGFSVTDALVHVGIMTEGEATRTDVFNWVETNSNCHYFTVSKSLLARIVTKFNLPTTNQEIGGKKTFTEREFLERERMKQACLDGVNGIKAQNRSAYQVALASM